jgi:hypothetical protein
MRIIILYRPNSDHGRKVEDYARDFSDVNPSMNVDLVSLETKEGADKAKAYDVTSYPAILVVDNTGAYQKLWQGEECPPLMQELASYSRG